MSFSIKDHLPNIRKGIYIAPSKKRVAFNFVGDLEFEQSKKIATMEVPLSNAWVVQDLGTGMLTFSLEMVFSGSDSDKQSQSMVEALSEMGSGMLLHPGGENILCVATGWKQKNSNVESINLSKLSVTFVKTLKQPYPAIQKDYAGDIDIAQKELLGPSRSLVEKLNRLSHKKVLAFKKGIELGLKKISKPFAEVALATSEISNALFLAKLYTQNLLNLDAPILETLASVGNIMALYRELDINLDDKKNAYDTALERIWNTEKTKNLDDAQTHMCKTLAISRFFAFKRSTNLNALQIADFANENIFIYQNLLKESVLEEDEIVQILEALRLSLGACYTMLEKYPKCKTFVLTEDSNPVNLAFDLYNNVEDCTKIIKDNCLTMDELFFLPKGKEVMYFG